MQDLNAKAPKNRKQEISPLLGSIIKIASLLVISGLVVLITFIIIESLQKDDQYVDMFENRIHINLNDFVILTKDGDYTNLSKDVREVVDALVEIGEHESSNFYFFFYYDSQKDDLDKELVAAVNNENIDSKVPIFIAYLDADEEGNSEMFNYLYNESELVDLDIRNSLNPEHNNSFVLTFNKLEDNQYEIIYSVSEQKTTIQGLVN